MPFVRAYFRRAAGAAATGTTQRRRLDVAIYGSDGTSLLRDGAAGRYQVDDVRFATALPGGFAEASCRLHAAVGRAWPGRAGLKMVISQGRRVLWWGWIEDLRRQGRNGETVTLTGIGPWQVMSQRLFSPDYSGTVYGDVALVNALGENASELSTDRSQVEATGVNIADLSWSWRSLAELIKTICDAGNTSYQQMLFAIWEASNRANGYPTSKLGNSDFETVAAGPVPGSWVWSALTGDPVLSSVTDRQQSGLYGAQMVRGAAAGDQEGQLSQSNIVVSASTSYTFDFSVYFGAVAGITAYVSVDWYDAGAGYLSTTATTTQTSDGTAGWQRYVEALTSPVGAATATVKLRGIMPDSGAQSFKVYDDAYMYATGAALAVDTKPRAHLWARDLSDYDYVLSPAMLESGLTIEQTTRQLANHVIGSYGSPVTYQTDSYGEDAASQALYRERFHVVASGSVSATVADNARRAYLAAFKDPLVEPQTFRLSRPGAVRSQYGRLVDPLWLRAGDRLKVLNGPLAGEVIMLTRTEWADGVMSCTPERAEDVAALLARV